MSVGSGSLTFDSVPGWPAVPVEAGLIEAVSVAVSSLDEVWVFGRGEIPVLVFDREGQFLRGWGNGQFVRPHGMWIGSDDSVFLVDDMGHSVRQYSERGELLRTLGPSGSPSATGVVGMDYRTIRPGCGPFNMPTDVVTLADGDLLVTDGYGNARVHRLSADGELKASWGEPGDGPAQFNVPHGIGVDAAERLYICDRENSRIQIFSSDGELLDIWTDVARPTEVFVAADGLVYVSELGFHAGVFPWNARDPSKTGGRVSIFDQDGRRLSRWGGGLDPSSPEDFYSPHDLQVDSQGSIYVAEVKVSATKGSDDDTSAFPTLRKFVRSNGASPL